jgi:hypothetical protein
MEHIVVGWIKQNEPTPIDQWSGAMQMSDIAVPMRNRRSLPTGIEQSAMRE